MTRNMIQANARLFGHLYEFCGRRGEGISTRDETRYISSKADDKEFLKHTKVITSLQFGLHRALIWAKTHTGDDVLGTIGFEFELLSRTVYEADYPNGFQVAILSDILPHPIESIYQIRNIIESGSANSGEYSGHDFDAISSLFPQVRAWKSNGPMDDQSIWKLFLMVSVNECQLGGSWIDDRLAEEIIALTELNTPSLPYKSLCRSVFDLDPRTLFMALYRCIEATYAYESCRRVAAKLSLDMQWQEIAKNLVSTIGWRPQEASSLQVILRYALEEDLVSLCESIKVEANADYAASAAVGIYNLRNRIVHYRPWEEAISIEEYDWNVICTQLVRIILNIYDQAYRIELQPFD